MLGAGQAGTCVLTLVERKSGFVAVGKLQQRTGAQVNDRAHRLIRAQPRRVRTITVDNGTEFHSYAALERVVPARFYFATPHHAWERGTNENTNSLIRQYLPKPASMAPAHPTRLQSHRRKAERSPPKAPRLSNPGGMLCPMNPGGKPAIAANVAVQS